MATPLDKIPPQNLEAEQSVLGALLIDREAIVQIADFLRPEDFYHEKNGMVFAAMLELYEHRDPIDVLSLANRLEEKKQLDIVGGRAALAQFANVVPTASHVINYATIVQRKSTLRRLLAAGEKITGLAFEESEDVSDTLDLAEQTLFGVSQQYLKQHFIPIKNVLTDAFDRIDDLHRDSGKLRGLPTGFTDLDALLAGLQKSDLVVLAARPSVGKTTLALDIARLAAVQSKTPVGVFSLEMSKEQLVDRLLCAQAGIGLWKMRTGKLSEDEDFQRLGDAMGILSESPIFIDDSATANVMEIRTKARRLQSEHGLGLIIIDYIQLMQGRSNVENRVQEVAEITRALKSLARELNVPVLALSQLSRAVELNKPAIPKLAHLRESGSIEQDADVVLFIYRKAADRNYRLDEIPPEDRNLAELHIAKHRNGPTGLVRLFFDEDTTSFKNLTTNYVQ